VFVTPSTTTGTRPLKNAIDYLHEEWKHKPSVRFLRGVAAGTRAVQQLKQVVTHSA